MYQHYTKSHSPPCSLQVSILQITLKNVIARMEVEVFEVNVYKLIWGLGKLLQEKKIISETLRLYFRLFTVPDEIGYYGCSNNRVLTALLEYFDLVPTGIGQAKTNF